MDSADIKEMVRNRYGAIAAASASCCSTATSCCSPEQVKAGRIGYSEAELSAVPEGANLGLGCGNPQAIAALRPGEVLIDLGSGAGFDCLLAAPEVRPEGRVIGVDMTHEMLSKARDTPPASARRMSIPAGRTRAPADRRQHRRCDHFQLRHQPGARQGAGVPRGVPRAEAGGRLATPTW